MNFLRLLPALVGFTALFLAGCSKSGSSGHSGGGHAHTAPHGGTLIELGEHAYNLELVRDAAAGKLTVYILDGHAENFVRIAAKEIEVVAIAGGQRRPLVLTAVANPATGETVGNTSQFTAEAEWLTAAPEFDGVLTRLEIRGAVYANVPFNFPKGNEP